MTDTIEARFDTLGELLRDIAIRAGLRFRVVQIDDELQFQVLEIMDRSATVRMDIDNGTLKAQTSAVLAPDTTRVINAGQGEAELRTLLESSTTSSEQAEEDWGRRIESFNDARNVSTTDGLAADGELELLDGAGGISLAAVPVDETTMQLDRDYGVGDIVSAVVDGAETVSTVTEVQIVAGTSGVTVGFSLGDSLAFDARRSLQSSVDATASRIATLEASIVSEPTSMNIADATTVGRALLTAEDQAEARGVIGAGTSSVADLGDLGDVDTTGATTGDALVFDSITGWAPVPLSGGGGGESAYQATVTVPTGWTTSTTITVAGMVEPCMVGPASPDASAAWAAGEWWITSADGEITITGTAPVAAVDVVVLWWV